MEITLRWPNGVYRQVKVDLETKEVIDELGPPDSVVVWADPDNSLLQMTYYPGDIPDARSDSE